MLASGNKKVKVNNLVSIDQTVFVQHQSDKHFLKLYSLLIIVALFEVKS